MFKAKKKIIQKWQKIEGLAVVAELLIALFAQGWSIRQLTVNELQGPCELIRDLFIK